MTPRSSEPRTPQRKTGLVSAWSRSQHSIPSPYQPPPRRVVLPASAPPDTPKTTDRIRRLTFDPTLSHSQRPPVYPSLPPSIPTEPAAMRRAQQSKAAIHTPPTPRRRVVPNILPEGELEPAYSQTKLEYTKHVPHFQPCLPLSPGANNATTKVQVEEGCCSSGRYGGVSSYDLRSAQVASQVESFMPQGTPAHSRNGFVNFQDTHMQTHDKMAGKHTVRPINNDDFDSRILRVFPGFVGNNAGDIPTTTTDRPVKPQTGRTIAGTELTNYTQNQQAADYKNLLNDSEPEETWESRRGAPMVPEAHSWIESDLFAQQWYNAVILSYRQDAREGERLGGTDEEKDREMQAKQAGHLTGVSVELEIARHKFEADLLRRARDMISRDNGIMPRGAIGEPAGDGEPQPWSDGVSGTRRQAW